MGCCVGLGGVEVELFLFGGVVQVAAKDQSSELVVLQPVHQGLLVPLVSLIVEDEYASETVQYPTLLKVVIQLQVLVDRI